MFFQQANEVLSVLRRAFADPGNDGPHPPFHLAGLERADLVKSPRCQELFYQAWASRLINVDAPGATSPNLRSLGHTRCLRPMFPLDDGVDFTPRAKVFRRPANGR